MLLEQFMSNVIPFPTKTEDDEEQPYAVLYDGDVAYAVPLITIRSMALGLVDRNTMDHYHLIMQLESIRLQQSKIIHFRKLPIILWTIYQSVMVNGEKI